MRAWSRRPTSVCRLRQARRACATNARRLPCVRHLRVASAHAAASAAEGRDATHLLFRELEVEHVEVLLEVFLAGRLGDGGDLVLLQEPAQGRLGRRLAVRVAYLPERGIILYSAAGEWGVGGE